METEKTKKSSGGRTGLVILAILCSSFLIYYSVMSMLGPSRKLEELRKELAAGKADRQKEDDKLFADTAYRRLSRERAFLQSRIIMAESDSIYLTINPADSSMDLEISGVVVHRSKMSSFKASRMLISGNEDVIYPLLSSPLSIVSDLSTIRKEPLMIKMAPKDTSEYKPDIMPDTSITEPVSYILEMNDGIRIFVSQDETEKASDRRAILKFDLTDRLKQTWKAIKRVAVLKVPEYHPFIKIRLPRADAKIIYRAIPKNGQISLYI